MMSVPAYHENHSSTAAASPATTAAPVHAPPSYPSYAHPAQQPPAAPPDAQTQSPSSSQNAGPRLSQPPPVYSTGPDSHGLVSAVQQQQQPPHHHHHQPNPHPHPHHAPFRPHQHAVTPPLQYSSMGGHGTSASPPGNQAPTPNASSASPPQKKNTRIPRACDLCSQRKVKVSRFPSSPRLTRVSFRMSPNTDSSDCSVKVGFRHADPAAS